MPRQRDGYDGIIITMDGELWYKYRYCVVVVDGRRVSYMMTREWWWYVGAKYSKVVPSIWSLLHSIYKGEISSQ